MTSLLWKGTDFSLSILEIWFSDGLGGVRLMVGLGDLRGLFQWFHDPMILQRFLPLLGHPGHPLGKTGCRNNCMCWSGSTCGRRGKGRVEGTFSFCNQDCGILDTSSSRANHQCTLQHINLQHPLHPWGSVTAGKAGRTAKHRWLQEVLGAEPVHRFGRQWAHLLCGRLLGAGLVIGPQQTENDHGSFTEVASQYRP